MCTSYEYFKILFSCSAVVSLRNVGGVSIQDPFSEGSDPAFHNKRGGAPYQQGGGPADPSMRMQYDANKDPYGGPRKGEEWTDHIG